MLGMTDGVLLGWGYEGKDLEDLLLDARAQRIDTIVDVRLTPLSRKRGFSKTRLAEACIAAGLRYEHRRELGNPKDNRADFADKGPDGVAARERFRNEILATERAEVTLRELAERRDGGERIFLLCFERDESCCHRAEVFHAASALPHGVA